MGIAQQWYPREIKVNPRLIVGVYGGEEPLKGHGDWREDENQERVVSQKSGEEFPEGEGSSGKVRIVLAQAAVTKCHGPGVGGPLTGFQTVACSICPHVAERDIQTETQTSLLLLLRMLIQSSKPNYLPRSHL